MTYNFATASRSNQCYFDRVPERLVLEGYRHWLAGYETGSIQPWELAWNIYATALGGTDGRKAMGELSNYIRTLKKCSTCPLRAYPFHSHHLCVEECLTMGLIAGLQHSDDTVELCLAHLACPKAQSEVEAAGYMFATTLRELNQILIPVPRHVIEDVTMRASSNQLH